jgi:hypothetical protein
MFGNSFDWPVYWPEAFVPTRPPAKELIPVAFAPDDAPPPGIIPLLLILLFILIFN